VYADLGVAQADLVQAGLLKNPLFDAVVTFPVSGRRPDLDLNAVMSFLDIFYLPLRKRVAAGRFEEAKTRVSSAVLDLAGQVRSTFYTHQGNEQMVELRQSIVQALAASLDVAQRLHQAGNISALDYARERVLLEGTKLRLGSAEVASRQSRERLNILMGLWGKETEWQTEGRLAEMPNDAVAVDGIERMAISHSIDLVQGRQRIAVAGEQLGFDRSSALLPDFSIGARGERRERGWEVGPILEFPIPLFDQGQARIGRAAAELRRSQQEYYALAVRVRATARAVADRLQGSRDRALYYRDVVLPLQELLVSEAQLHYNAMQLGPIQLLRAREQQIEAASGYVDGLRDYWLAYSDYQQLLSGRLPQASGTSSGGVLLLWAAAGESVQ
jgi:cobalt-zinc-cadmium efflux system outer membrane protein